MLYSYSTFSLFHSSPVVPKVFAPEISWDEKQEQARVARERKRYEQTINEVTTELEAMRAKVAELLEENNKLPEAERMDVHDFELDVEEQQRRVNEGMDKEDDLRFELKAWQIGNEKWQYARCLKITLNVTFEYFNFGIF